MRGRRWTGWGWAVLALLLLCAGAVRGRQAARVDALGDEMLHLPSYRNHYGQESIYPIFRRRLEVPGGVPASLRPLLQRYYDSGPLAQRSLLIINDGHPPFHPLLLELVQVVTYDSLMTMRALSLLVSLAGVVLAFWLGRELSDFALGLLLAAEFAVALVPAYFGGVARVYAFVEPAMLWFSLCALRACKSGVFLDARVLGAALLVQLVQWFSWPLVGASVVCLAFFRVRSGTKPLSLLRTSAWYIAASLLLLAYLFVQTKNPTLRHAGSPSVDLSAAARSLAQVGPTSWFDLVLPGAARVGAGAAVALAIVGVWKGGTLVPDARARIACLFVPALVGLLLLLLAPKHVRHVAVLAVPLFTLVALGVRSLVGPRRAGGLAVAWAALGAVVQLSAASPHNLMLADDAPGFARTASTLRGEIARSGRWVSFPYFVADSYYRFVPGVPAPEQPQSLAELASILEGGAPLTVVMYVGTKLDPTLRARLQPVARVDGHTAIYRLQSP